MSRLWLKEDTKILISRLKDLPELWNVWCPDYRNREKKTAAVERLSVEFNTDCTEISRKIHNLRTQFNNELRRLREKNCYQGANGQFYTSQWEYFESLQFMVVGKIEPRNESWGSTLSDDQQDLPTSPFVYNTARHTESLPKKRKGELVNTSADIFNRPQCDDIIFGNFVSSTLRNLRCDARKRLLKRQILKLILAAEEAEEESFAPEQIVVKNEPEFETQEHDPLTYQNNSYIDN